ncbi:MAG: PP0621 family protein [Pseudomonas sp.]|uniref:PP0621 family protein n=1 Tax=Pseudomonas abieticivorans TaxID=2931382 RepID=UPI0020BD7CA8|nr:PP0621 family protein [Pseudomonas sp. PIA16]MDE1168131.1 PP0621 family protein [Pseudomonas sp.]
MIRLIFWIVIVFAGIWLWRKFKAGVSQPQSPPGQKTLQMVRCAHCGVHLPHDRALHRGQEWYCSQAHLEQGPGPRER